MLFAWSEFAISKEDRRNVSSTDDELLLGSATDDLLGLELSSKVPLQILLFCNMEQGIRELETAAELLMVINDSLVACTNF